MLEQLLETYQSLCEEAKQYEGARVLIDIHKSLGNRTRVVTFTLEANGERKETKMDPIDADEFDTAMFPQLYYEFLVRNKHAEHYQEYIHPATRENLYVALVSSNGAFEADRVSEEMENIMAEKNELVESQEKSIKEAYPHMQFVDGKIDLDEVERQHDAKLRAVLERGLTIADLIDPVTGKVSLDRVETYAEKVVKDHSVGEIRLDKAINDAVGISHMLEHDMSTPEKTEEYFRRIFLSEDYKLDLDAVEKVADEKIAKDVAERVIKEHTEQGIPLQQWIDQVTGVTQTKKAVSKHDKRTEELKEIFTDGKIDLDFAVQLVSKRLEEILKHGITESDLIDEETKKINLNRVESLAEKIVREKSVGENVPILEVIEEVTGVKSDNEKDTSYARRAVEYNELFTGGKLDLDAVAKIADAKTRAVLGHGVIERDIALEYSQLFTDGKLDLDKLNTFKNKKIEEILSHETIRNDLLEKYRSQIVTEDGKIDLDAAKAIVDDKLMQIVKRGIKAEDFVNDKTQKLDLDRVERFMSLMGDATPKLEEDALETHNDLSYGEQALVYESVFSGDKIDLDELIRVADEKMKAILTSGLEEKNFIDYETGKINLDLVTTYANMVVKADDTKKAVAEANQYVEKYQNDVREAKNYRFSKSSHSEKEEELSEDVQSQLLKYSNQLQQLIARGVSYQDLQFQQLVGQMANLIRYNRLEKTNEKEEMPNLVAKLLDMPKKPTDNYKKLRQRVAFVKAKVLSDSVNFENYQHEFNQYYAFSRIFENAQKRGMITPDLLEMSKVINLNYSNINYQLMMSIYSAMGQPVEYQVEPSKKIIVSGELQKMLDDEELSKISNEMCQLSLENTILSFVGNDLKDTDEYKRYMGECVSKYNLLEASYNDRVRYNSENIDRNDVISAIRYSLINFHPVSIEIVEQGKDNYRIVIQRTNRRPLEFDVDRQKLIDVVCMIRESEIEERVSSDGKSVKLEKKIYSNGITHDDSKNAVLQLLTDDENEIKVSLNDELLLASIEKFLNCVPMEQKEVRKK